MESSKYTLFCWLIWFVFLLLLLLSFFFFYFGGGFFVLFCFVVFWLVFVFGGGGGGFFMHFLSCRNAHSWKEEWQPSTRELLLQCLMLKVLEVHSKYLCYFFSKEMALLKPLVYSEHFIQFQTQKLCIFKKDSYWIKRFRVDPIFLNSSEESRCSLTQY